MPTHSAPRLKLTKITANGYKCLREVTVQPKSALAVFVGRNNTGKSTILDAFDFIREAAADPREAVAKRGSSLASLQWCFLPDEDCTLSFEFDVPASLRDQALGWLISKKDSSTVLDSARRTFAAPTSFRSSHTSSHLGGRLPK